MKVAYVNIFMQAKWELPEYRQLSIKVKYYFPDIINSPAIPKSSSTVNVVSKVVRQ